MDTLGFTGALYPRNKVLATHATGVSVHIRWLGLRREKLPNQTLRSKPHQNPLLVVCVRGRFPSVFIQTFPGSKTALLTWGTKGPERDDIE